MSMFALSGKIRKGLALGLVAGMTTLGSACSISRQQELQLGQQYSAQINAELPIANDAAVIRYINALGNEIAAVGDRNLSYQFYVVNAFAVPGGYVYVNRGLIEATDNLSEL
ncbi:MAG: peptidase M48 Ste24p, partial [Longimicrobiales bacterium]